MIANTPLDKLVNHFDHSIPLYLQIAEGLMEQIEAGGLPPGDRLPSERDLSKHLGVNRMTLRRALQRLELQGMLVRRQGDGTYVAAPKIERQAGELVSFSRGMRRRGYLPGAHLLHFDKHPAESTVGRELQVPEGSPVFYFLRIRSLANEPVMLEKFWVSADHFPDLEKFDLVGRFFYDIIESEYGMKVTSARQSLEAVVATDYEARMLEIPVGAPLMLERRLSFNENGVPIEYGKDLYRGDRFRFITDLAPMEKG
jgi:GntR family transcriptional regulator, N-acetylglucosamine utilization regulator